MKFAWSNYYDHNNLPNNPHLRSKSVKSYGNQTPTSKSKTKTGMYINNSTNKTIKNYVNNKLYQLSNPSTANKEIDNKVIINYPKVNAGLNEYNLLKQQNMQLKQILNETKDKYNEMKTQLQLLYKELNIKDELTYNDLTNPKNGVKPINLNYQLQLEYIRNNNNKNSFSINTLTVSDDE